MVSKSSGARAPRWARILALAAAAHGACAAGGATATRPRWETGPHSESGPRAEPRVVAEAWPEADVLFRRDPRWLGADAAFSIPLGGGRVLWLFGDTFVGLADAPSSTESRSRRGSVMVRNTIAIQTGLDPRTAAMAFRWRTEGGRPASFFAEDGDRWYWPLHGMRLRDGTLALFLARVRGTPGEGLGFAAEGWRLALVAAREADGDPNDWRPRIVEPGAWPRGLIAAQGLIEADGKIVGIATREPGDHAGSLVRWDPGDLAAGRLAEGEWWVGEARGWARADRLTGAEPASVMADASPELSVHFDRQLGRYVHVASLGFGATNLGIAFADRPMGPWSAPRAIFRPAESGLAGILVYAGKAHPELDAGTRADGAPWLAATYATNTLDDFPRLVADTSLYYPRFVRIGLEPVE